MKNAQGINRKTGAGEGMGKRGFSTCGGVAAPVSNKGGVEENPIMKHGEPAKPKSAY